MPAESKSQQEAAAMALAAKRGKIDPKTLKGAAKDMYNSMTEEQLEHYASTKSKDLPEKKEPKKAEEGAVVNPRTLISEGLVEEDA